MQPFPCLGSCFLIPWGWRGHINRGRSRQQNPLSRRCVYKVWHPHCGTECHYNGLSVFIEHLQAADHGLRVLVLGTLRQWEPGSRLLEFQMTVFLSKSAPLRCFHLLDHPGLPRRPLRTPGTEFLSRSLVMISFLTLSRHLRG